jgi:hypothetical protein
MSMTVENIKAQVATIPMKELLAVWVGEDGSIHINHSDMPVPVFCMMKEVIGLAIIRALTPAPKPTNKNGIVTPLNPFVQSK